MPEETTGLMVKVKWKLEKFDGDRKEGDVPVEVLEGEDEIPLAIFQEMQNGSDKRRS